MSFKESVLFAKNFLRHPTRNASIIPSSRRASEAMIKDVDFSKVNSVVELGPGTGCFTEVLLEHCRPGTRVLLVEFEPSYSRLLEDKFGDRVIVECESAHLLDSLLKKHGMVPDLIVSGLPFDVPDQDRLFNSILTLTRSGSKFRFFTFLPPVMKKVYKSLPVEKKGFTFFNFPPLWVYGVN